MKELDWIFEDEELNPNEPLKIGDRIYYSGSVKYYKNGHFHKLNYVEIIDRIFNVKKQDNQWLFQMVNFNFNTTTTIWIVYDEKNIKIL